MSTVKYFGGHHFYMQVKGAVVDNMAFVSPVSPCGLIAQEEDIEDRYIVVIPTTMLSDDMKDKLLPILEKHFGEENVFYGQELKYIADKKAVTGELFEIIGFSDPDKDLVRLVETVMSIINAK